MKAILALVFLASLASATTFQRFDRWSCNFPNKMPSAMMRGYFVNIDYDLVAGKGTAFMYPDCPVCHVRPREIPVNRGGHERTLIYSNSNENFNLRIVKTNTTPTRGPYMATNGDSVGTCTPRQ